MSQWAPINQVNHKDQLGTLLFLIYINNLFGNLNSKAKLFTNDTLIFFSDRLYELSTHQKYIKVSRKSDRDIQTENNIYPRDNQESRSGHIFWEISQTISSSSKLYQNYYSSKQLSKKSLGLHFDKKPVFHWHPNEKLKKTQN